MRKERILPIRPDVVPYDRVRLHTYAYNGDNIEQKRRIEDDMLAQTRGTHDKCESTCPFRLFDPSRTMFKTSQSVYKYCSTYPNKVWMYLCVYGIWGDVDNIEIIAAPVSYGYCLPIYRQLSCLFANTQCVKCVYVLLYVMPTRMNLICK